MKKGILAAWLAVCMLALSGCGALDNAMKKIADDQRAAQLASPTTGSADQIDWSFVPVVRKLARDLFTQSFPQAQVTDDSVACKNGDSSRVIVVLSYTLDGKSGSYGFDYEKDEQGEYVLKRYGGGVTTDDL